MWLTLMALGEPSGRECWGNIISVNSGESFMVAGGNAEGWLEMYLLKPFSRLDTTGSTVANTPTTPPFQAGLSPAPKPRPDYFQSGRDNLAGSCFLPMYLISSTWHHNPLMGTSAVLLRGR